MGFLDRFKRNKYAKFKCEDFAREFKRNFEEELKDIPDMASFLSYWEQVCPKDANLLYAKGISDSEKFSQEDMIEIYKTAIKEHPYDYSLEKWFRFTLKGTIAVKNGESYSNFTKNMIDKNYDAYDFVIPPENEESSPSYESSHLDDDCVNEDSDLNDSYFEMKINNNRAEALNNHLNSLEIRNVYDHDVKNFEFLEDLINSGDNEIMLDYDIVLSDAEKERFSHGITINDDLIIDGNNHVIDLFGNSSIFFVEADNITIKNLNFKNVHSTEAPFISNNSNSLILENCNFINCISDKFGIIKNSNCIKLISCNFENFFGAMMGAILNSEGPACLVDCNFDNCKSKMGACVFNSAGTLNINDCNFENCVVDGEGGAIQNMGGDAKIISSNFNNNSSERGGAICSSARLNLEDCNFKDNNAKLEGGSIEIRSNDCSFSNCNISESSAISGGAIFNYGSLQLVDCIIEKCSSKLGGGIVNVKEITLDSCIFESNVGTDGGGAIFNHDSGSLTFKSCDFEKNASNLGGGIDNRGQVSFYDCTFERNLGTQVTGGAVLNHGNVLLEDCEFDDNCAKLAGGAISGGKGSVTISNCNFNENRNDHFMGSCTVFMVDSEFIATNSNFSHNKGKGADLKFENCILKLENCNFENGESNKLLGKDSELTIKSCAFEKSYTLSSIGNFNVHVLPDEKEDINAVNEGCNITII